MALWMRFSFSVYSGWLTAATILGAANMLKYLGMSEENGYDEEFYTVVILWIALVIFGLTTFVNNDWIYGSVLLWATSAIRSENLLQSTLVDQTLKAIISIMIPLDLSVAFFG